MAGSPRWKVYSPTGEYVASLKHMDDAACIVALYGDGAKIRDGLNRRRIVWHEGREEFPAGESYDGVARVIWSRVRGED